MKRMEGRTVLVTGASKGVGRAIALALAHEGASLALLSRTGAGLEGLSREIAATGVAVSAGGADVLKPAEIDAAVGAALKAHGKIDVLVNAAGGRLVGRLDEIDSQLWWSFVELKVRGSFHMSRRLLPAMIERKWG